MLLRRSALAVLWVMVTLDVCRHAVTAAEPSDADKARLRLRVSPGLEVSLWAGEPLIQNITSVSFDDTGRAYVVETGRRRTSVFDIRNFKEWVTDDLALRSVEDRADYLRRMLATNEAFLAAATKSGRGGFGDFNQDGVVNVQDLEVESERIRLVWDADRDGRADAATTFADGFRTSVSGVAAGVLAQGSNVWFTCIPDLWQFDAASTAGPNAPIGEHPGVPPQNAQRLHHGFGVHIAYGGHDMHGLIRGPDGRLYFSIGDRGATVTTREGRVLSAPDTGSVFRCEPDGSALEIFATGLRNPQELAFDEFGNLWTGDNNGDGGDQARWTLVLEGADYGWTIGWQWLPRMGAWNSERLWQTRESNTAAYLVPPVAHVGHGPAGIAYYPGTGLGAEFEGAFVYADFPGGIRTFRVEPDGAFFRMASASGTTAAPAAWLQDNSVTNFTGKLLWNLSPVDVTFPPFGGVIVADWVEGWEKTGKGRLWWIQDPALAHSTTIADTRRLLAEGMAGRPESECSELLGHRDMRVRLNAQWELASRGLPAWNPLAEVALRGTNPRARRHAIWGLGQILRNAEGRTPQVELLDWNRLLPLLESPDAEVRAHAARLFGEARFANAQRALWRLITDANARVAAQAILAGRDLWHGVVSKAGLRVRLSWRHRLYEALPSRLQELVPNPGADFILHVPEQELVQAVVRHGGEDPVLRHALVQFYAEFLRTYRWGAPEAASEMLPPGSPKDLQLALLLAQRSLDDPGTAASLTNRNPQLVLEAARAIHDRPIEAAMPDLAALLDGAPGYSLLRQSKDMPPGLKFTGNEWLTWVLHRSVNAAFRLGGTTNATRLALLAVQDAVPDSVRIEALSALGDWGRPPSVDRVVGLHRPIPARDPGPAREALAGAWPELESIAPLLVLTAALDAVEALEWTGRAAALDALESHADLAIRTEVGRRKAARAVVPVGDLREQLVSGSLSERQEALQALAGSADPAATGALDEISGKWTRGEWPPALALDLMEALARRRPGHPVLVAWTNSWRSDDPIAADRLALEGGNSLRGRRLFAERAEWGCQRCHRLGGEGGEVGPPLDGLGHRRGREHVLRSILHPNDAIAEGFETAVVTRRDGSVAIGVVKADRPDTLELETPEEGRVVIQKAEIESRERGLSTMPDGLGDLMTPRELRDLIEALTTE
ncbi:MAG: PQQ-dependent sugar dehydrogenase [Verrucomicrobia bacterium]|nr:PQQ-dependent sugar dehydrogenase [Verrucomicrobiota bacterium]